MSDEDGNELVDLDPIGEDDSPDDEPLRMSPAAILEARRRLEERLEEKRLQKLIQDYDFELD